MSDGFIEFEPSALTSDHPADWLCGCKGKGLDDYVLTVEEGTASVRHKGCGLPVTDYSEDINLEETAVRVEWVPDGCDPPGGWHGVDTRCDCGYSLSIAVVRDEGGAA